MRSAYDRVVRTLVLSVGIGSVVFTLLGIPAIIEQEPALNPGYTVLAASVFCGLPPVIAIASFRFSVRALRSLAGVHAVSAMVLLALWLPAMITADLPGDGLPWIINIIAVATCEAAIALPVLSAWVYTLLAAALSGVVSFLSGASDLSMAVQDAILITLISGFMMALLQLTLQAGREQDVAATAAQESAAASAAAETLERQRTRYQAFTHDDVLATLLAASQDGETPSEVTRRSAQRTLEKMDQFRLDLPLSVTFTLLELDDHLRTAARDLGVQYDTNLADSGIEPIDIPMEVCDALTEALTEAMRNSIRHGGWPDSRVVTRYALATRSSEGIRLIVRDDGKGFNQHRVSVDRLGVRLSILKRVNSQPGGAAEIVSSRGGGTTVTLDWKPDVNEH